MSIRKIGLSAALISFALLANISAAIAGGSRGGHWDHHDYGHGHGYQQCSHRYDGFRCFWRWR